jgi:hypothetical protein
MNNNSSVIETSPLPATFSIDYETGSVEAKTSEGTLIVHTVYDDNAKCMPGLAFEVKPTDPSGSVYLSPEDLQKLFAKFNAVSNNSTTYKLQIS